MGTKIHLEDETDRWRYVCPRGHRNWEPTNNHFWCASCARDHDDADPSFEALTDRKTGAELHRDQLDLVWPGEPAAGKSGGAA